MSPNYSVLISVYYKERPIYLKSALDSLLSWKTFYLLMILIGLKLFLYLII